jgi:hypothetical protein
MEFGDTIPLFFISICCIGVIPIIGFALLAVIRFILKDSQLATNIIITTIGIGVFAYSFPTWRIIVFLPFLLLQNCACASSLVITPQIVGEMLLSSIQYGAILIYPGIGLGFIISYCIVLPVTLAVRFFRKKNEAHSDISRSTDSSQPQT